MSDIPHIRVPDEILFPLDRLCNRFSKVATLDKYGRIELRGLKPQEKVVLEIVRPRILRPPPVEAVQTFG
jgi:hypothetical protein